MQHLQLTATALYARLFAALPTPHVAATPDMVVVDASDAYLDLFGLQRADVVGQDIVSLFPPDPASLDVDGVPFILTSFIRAAETRRPDPMPVARSDIVDHTGEIAERTGPTSRSRSWLRTPTRWCSSCRS